MSADTLDPVIHAPVRLRIVATLAALPDSDALSFARLQDILDLTPGNLITHLRKLEDAGYVNTDKTGNGNTARTLNRAHPPRAHRAGPLYQHPAGPHYRALDTASRSGRDL